MSNVPDDFMQYHCRKCGETPCDCRSPEDFCPCGEELDSEGKCSECDPVCDRCGLDADPLVEEGDDILCGPCAELMEDGRG